MDPFTCEEFFRRLDDYLDRELAPGELVRMDEHLAICKLCLVEFIFESHVLEDVKNKIRRVKSPPGLMARISEALAKEAQG